MKASELLAACSSRKRVPFTVPDAERSGHPGPHFWITVMTVVQKETYEAWIAANRSGGVLPADWKVRYMIACCSAEDGTPAFSADDAVVLSGLPANLVEAVVQIGLEINATDDAAIEAARKNF